MKTWRMIVAVLAMTVATATLSPAAGREDFKAFAEKKGDAVITIEAVVNIKYSGYGQQVDTEQKTETVGTVVNEQGLVVTALSTIDPGSFYTKHTGEEDQYVTRLKSLKYIMPDNREIEAGVVLRDPDLDLVFLKPTEEVKDPFTFVALDKGVKLAVLDEAYALSRMPRIARRTVACMSGEIQAIIDKPRMLYITDAEITSARPGSAVFTADGKLIGINAYHVFPGGQKALGDNDQPYIPVVVPTDTVKEVADQAVDQAPQTATEGESAPADDSSTSEKKQEDSQ